MVLCTQGTSLWVVTAQKSTERRPNLQKPGLAMFQQLDAIYCMYFLTAKVD